MLFFFFQAEDGIRDADVTGVQTCALPIFPGTPATVDGVPGTWRVDPGAIGKSFEGRTALLSPFDRLIHDRDRALDRSEERRVGKECRSRRWPVHYKKSNGDYGLEQ